LVTIIVPRIVVFILKKFPLTPNSSLLSMFKTNKHPGGQPPANIISTHFKRLKKLANKSGCYYQKWLGDGLHTLKEAPRDSEIDSEDDQEALKGQVYDFEEQENQENA